MTNLMKMTMTMAMKIDNKAMEMIFPTGSGRDSLDLHDLRVEIDGIDINLITSWNFPLPDIRAETSSIESLRKGRRRDV